MLSSPTVSASAPASVRVQTQLQGAPPTTVWTRVSVRAQREAALWSNPLLQRNQHPSNSLSLIVGVPRCPPVTPRQGPHLRRNPRVLPLELVQPWRLASVGLEPVCQPVL